jgi:hypothetical protein
MSLTKEAGNSLGDQAIHRLVVTVILRPTFAAPGPYPASAAAGLAWSSPLGSLVPFIHSGRCRARVRSGAGSAWFTSARPPGRLSLDIEARHAR